MTFELTCYQIGDYAVPIAPARPTRALFDRNRHAYKCLPLSAGNAAGWELLCPEGFSATWDGGDGVAAVTIQRDADAAPNDQFFAKSHFAFGTLTFEPGILFRTNEGTSLWAMGPPNDPRDGIAPLAAIIETDWLPYTFTMNWQFTRPGTIRFEKGDPFCFITPSQLSSIIACQPTLHALADNPQLAEEHEAWRLDRDAFMARIHAGDPEAMKTPWRRLYFRGVHPEGLDARCPVEHHNKVRTKAPQPSENVAAATSIRPPQAASFITAKAPRETQFYQRQPQASVLVPPAQSTRVIRSEGDALAAGLPFLVVDNFVSRDLCDNLCRAFEENAHLCAGAEIPDPFWRDRLLYRAALAAAGSDAAERISQIVQSGIHRISEFYRPPTPLFADVAQLAAWREGMEMPAHVDNAYPDGRPHPMAHRAYSGVVYLNDEYEGGALYLPRLDVLIEPRRGMLVSLPADETHEHAVLRIGSGLRLTLPFFLTHDTSKADPSLLPKQSTFRTTHWLPGDLELVVSR